MKELSVGIVGYGEAGRLHAVHLARAGSRVLGVVSRRELEPGLARFASLADMLPRVDAVTIAVPNHLHATLALAAIRAEKAVMVEKPLALGERELDEIETELARRPVPFQVGFRLRWNPRLRLFREDLEPPAGVRCVYRLGIERLARGKPWTRTAAVSGGAFFTLGVHALDLARWLARARAEPLADLRAIAGDRDRSADFPLRIELGGRLASGTEIVAGADLRGEASFHLDVAADGVSPFPAGDHREEADAEYGAMMAEFVRRAETGELDPEETAEVLRVHRDLLEARRRAEEPAT